MTSTAAYSAEEIQRGIQRIFPADQHRFFGGWEARHTPGKDGTFSSVRIAGKPESSVQVTLADIQHWYSQRNSSAVLQTVAPCGYDTDFHSLEWEETYSGRIMVAPTLALCGDTTKTEHELLLDSTDETLAVTMRIDGETVGEGHGTLFVCRGRRMVGIRGMSTSEKWRRQKVASTILYSITQWAHGGGADAAALHLLDGNTGGEHLYRQHGFVPHHHYRYWATKGS